MVPDAEVVRSCRSCGAHDLLPFLSLGETPIANSLVSQDQLTEPDARFPLGVAFCRVCSLVQLTHELPADIIFGANYPYFSSYSDVLMRHAAEHVGNLIQRHSLNERSRVVEIASNDGYLLRNFVAAGLSPLGIEPTPGPAAAARKLGIRTIEAFFTRELAAHLRAEEGPADVIIANNVMAHVPDLNGFIEGLAILAADEAVITIENPYVRDLVDHCEFDTIYHEHFCYFSCTAVSHAMERHGLHLNDVEYFPQLHGGTLRWTVGPVAAPTENALTYLADEESQGLTRGAYYADFAERVAATIRRLTALLADITAAGSSIAAYGAAAKGATLLNAAGIDVRTIDFVVDRNPHKQGQWMPGARLPILDPGAILERMPAYLLLLAWNFREEVIAQQSEYRSRGGRFIVPIPEPVVV